MIAAPMSPTHRGAVRPAPAPIRVLTVALALAGVLLAACGSTVPSPTPTATQPVASASATASATPTPSPTPLPTPQYTNPADPAMVALIPTEIAGVTVTVPQADEFAITPGDFAVAYGDLGLRFTALQLAYVPRPRSLSLYVARVSPPAVTTAQLEPYLATAGQYVGIDGLHREPWKLETMDGRWVWVRPEDHATAAGTMIYTWTSGPYVFLMIGVDDTLNRAMFAALPGEAAPSPSPTPSETPGLQASGSPQPTPSATAP
jgi:hypothetical protein